MTAPSLQDASVAVTWFLLVCHSHELSFYRRESENSGTHWTLQGNETRRLHLRACTAYNAYCSVNPVPMNNGLLRGPKKEKARKSTI